jgi:hypothetical protein
VNYNDWVSFFKLNIFKFHHSKLQQSLDFSCINCYFSIFFIISRDYLCSLFWLVYANGILPLMGIETKQSSNIYIGSSLYFMVDFIILSFLSGLRHIVRVLLCHIFTYCEYFTVNRLTKMLTGII